MQLPSQISPSVLSQSFDEVRKGLECGRINTPDHFIDEMSEPCNFGTSHRPRSLPRHLRLDTTACLCVQRSMRAERTGSSLPLPT